MKWEILLHSHYSQHGNFLNGLTGILHIMKTRCGGAIGDKTFHFVTQIVITVKNRNTFFTR